MTRPIAVAPASRPEMHAVLEAAVLRGGGTIASLTDAEGLVFADPAAAADYPALAAQMPNLSWVQLPYAGIETFTHYLDPSLTYTCGKGTYAEPVAEHVIALALAGFRDMWKYIPATEWNDRTGRNLLGANVTILGGGGIAEHLVGLLGNWRCAITVVRRSTEPFPGAHRTVATADLHDALATADVVVCAWALTAETTGLLNTAAFNAMKDDAWLINVGRGAHAITDDLVAALQAGTIGGAGLDVTDPEPLPPGHPLWSIPNCIITPHVGNTPEMGLPLIAERVETNTRNFIAGEPLVGLVDPAAGY